MSIFLLQKLSHVCSRGHRDLMAGIEGLGKASHVLGHDSAKDLVPCRQEERCSRRVVSLIQLPVLRCFQDRAGIDATHGNLQNKTAG